MKKETRFVIVRKHPDFDGDCLVFTPFGFRRESVVYAEAGAALFAEEYLAGMTLSLLAAAIDCDEEWLGEVRAAEVELGEAGEIKGFRLLDSVGDEPDQVYEVFHRVSGKILQVRAWNAIDAVKGETVDCPVLEMKVGDDFAAEWRVKRIASARVGGKDVYFSVRRKWG